MFDKEENLQWSYRALGMYRQYTEHEGEPHLEHIRLASARNRYGNVDETRKRNQYAPLQSMRKI